MPILDSIKSFVASHQSLIQEIEAMTVQEALNLVHTLYPQDQVLLDILHKISADIAKIQGMQQ